MTGILVVLGIAAEAAAGFLLMRKIDRWMHRVEQDRPIKER